MRKYSIFAGLHLPVIIGIAVGVVVLILVAIIGIIVWRRKFKSQTK